MKAKSTLLKASIFAAAMILSLLMVITALPAFADNSGNGHGEILSASNISISGDITMKFYYTNVDESGFEDDDFVRITVPTQSGGKITTDIPVGELKEDGNRYVVEVPVAYAQQTDKITMQWFKDGVGGKIRERSVKDYADKVLDLAKNGSDAQKEAYAPVVTPVINMLNTGAAAQILHNYNNDTPEQLANFGLFPAGNPIDNMLPEHFYDVKGEPEHTDSSEYISFIGGQVFLQSKVNLRVYVECPDSVTTAKVNNGTTTASVKVKKDSTGRKYVGINNIVATNFNNRYTITLAYNNVEESFSYSVLDYAKDTLESIATSSAQKDVARALYLFYSHTMAYNTRGDEVPYVPGPKDKACAHERAYLEGEQIACPDCGNAYTATKLDVSVAADSPKVYADEAGKVTFVFALSGDVNLTSIVFTPKCEGVEFTLDKATLSFDDDTYDITADKNFLVLNKDVNTALGAGTIVTATYNVTAPVGLHKVSLVVREATDKNGAEIKDLSKIIAGITTFEAFNKECKDHTPVYAPTEDGTHRAFCNVCHKFLGEEAHKYVETYKDTGLIRTYMFQCACGAIESSREMTIGEEAPNVILTPADIAASLERTTHKPTSMGAAVISADGTYVTLHNDTKATDEGFFFPYVGDDTTVTGQYVAIKYRTTRGASWEFYVGANNGNSSAHGKQDNFYLYETSRYNPEAEQKDKYNLSDRVKGGIVADGEWHVTIVDLAAVLGDEEGERNAKFKPDEDGKYRTDYFRWDIFNEASSSDVTVDVAYIAFADSIEKLTGVENTNEYMFIRQYFEYSSNTYPVAIPMSGITGNYYFDANFLAKRDDDGVATYVVDNEHNGMTYTNFKVATKNGQQLFELWNHPSYMLSNAGNYIGIFYRMEAKEGQWFNFYVNSTSGSAKAGCYDAVYPIEDGEWHFTVGDITGVKSSDGQHHYNSEEGIASFRFDYFNVDGRTGSEYVDVAFIAMFQSEEDAYAYAKAYYEMYNLDCSHVLVDDGCHTTCAICGFQSDKHSEFDGEWTPELSEGGSDKLYEQKICPTCGHVAERREIPKVVCIDSFRVDGTSTAHIAQNNGGASTGLGFRINTVTTSHDLPTQFTDGKFITRQAALAGWAGINGGAEKYVYRINGGAWQDAVTTINNVSNAIKEAIASNNPDVKNFGDNVYFAIATADLQETYGGQTLTIEFGAVPTQNPGAADNPNVVVFTKLNNVHVVKTTAINSIDSFTISAEAGAANGNVYTLTATNKGLLNIECPADAGTAYKVTAINRRTQQMITTDDMVNGFITVKTNAGDTIVVKIEATAEDLPAVSGTFTATNFYGAYGSDLTVSPDQSGKLSTDSEGNQVVTAVADNADTNVKILDGVVVKAKYLAITYKSNGFAKTNSVFTSHSTDGTTFTGIIEKTRCSKPIDFISDGKWHTVIVDVSALTQYGDARQYGTTINALRIDFSYLAKDSTLTIKGIEFNDDYTVLMRKTGTVTTMEKSGMSLVNEYGSGTLEFSRDEENNLVVKNKDKVGDQYFYLVSEKPVPGKYVSITLRANNDASKVSAFYTWVYDPTTGVKNGTHKSPSCPTLPKGEWVTVIMDLEYYFGDNAQLISIRLDALENTAANAGSLTIKNFAVYEDFDAAMASGTGSSKTVLLGGNNESGMLGDTTYSIPAGDSNGTKVHWTAPSTGMYQFTLPEVDGTDYTVTVTNNTKNTTVSSADASNGIISIYAKSGEEIIVTVSASPVDGEYPALNVTLNTSYFYAAYGKDYTPDGNTSSLLVARDGDYAIIQRKASGTAYFNIINNRVGRYVAITYKATETIKVKNTFSKFIMPDGKEIGWTGTRPGDGTSGELTRNYPSIKFEQTTEWKTIIIDTYTCMNYKYTDTQFVAAPEGSVLYSLRADLDTTSVDSILTIKGIEASDNLEALAARFENATLPK